MNGTGFQGVRLSGSLEVSLFDCSVPGLIDFHHGEFLLL